MCRMIEARVCICAGVRARACAGVRVCAHVCLRMMYAVVPLTVGYSLLQ
jgi:hypothetical protein